MKTFSLGLSFLTHPKGRITPPIIKVMGIGGVGNGTCVCGLIPPSATSLGVLRSWEMEDGADYGESPPPPVFIPIVPTLEAHIYLLSSRMRQLRQPAQSSLVGSPSSEAPGKRWLPRDVHCGGIEELEGQRVVELP